MHRWWCVLCLHITCAYTGKKVSPGVHERRDLDLWLKIFAFSQALLSNQPSVTPRSTLWFHKQVITILIIAKHTCESFDKVLSGDTVYPFRIKAPWKCMRHKHSIRILWVLCVLVHLETVRKFTSTRTTQSVIHSLWRWFFMVTYMYRLHFNGLTSTAWSTTVEIYPSKHEEQSEHCT